MRLPNKNVSVKDSILPRLPILLNSIPDLGIEIRKLYAIVNKEFDSVLDFRDSLLSLLILNKIKIINNIIMKGE